MAAIIDELKTLFSEIKFTREERKFASSIKLKSKNMQKGWIIIMSHPRGEFWTDHKIVLAVFTFHSLTRLEKEDKNVKLKSQKEMPRTAFHLASYNWTGAKNSCSVIYFQRRSSYIYMLNIDASET